MIYHNDYLHLYNCYILDDFDNSIPELTHIRLLTILPQDNIVIHTPTNGDSDRNKS